MELSFPECRKCNEGVLLPLSDYGDVSPGDTLHLLLTWQATRPFDRDLKLFVHLLDRSEQIMAQADPLAGAGADPDLGRPGNAGRQRRA